MRKSIPFPIEERASAARPRLKAAPGAMPHPSAAGMSKTFTVIETVA